MRRLFSGGRRTRDAKTGLMGGQHSWRSRQVACADRAAINIRPRSIILIVWKNGCRAVFNQCLSFFLKYMHITE
jgi:hypothetical protein